MPEITDDPRPLADVVRDYILAVCASCNWNLGRAAAVLDVASKTLYNHLHRYADQGIVSHEHRDGATKATWGRRDAA